MRLLLCTALLLVVVNDTPAYAQSLAPAADMLHDTEPAVPTTADWHQHAATRPAFYQRDMHSFTVSRVDAMQRKTPRWVKWGLIGAAGGAVTFALLGRSTIEGEPNPVLQDAALGAVAGFVVIGGAIAFYDFVCAPDSSSRRAGLC